MHRISYSHRWCTRLSLLRFLPMQLTGSSRVPSASSTSFNTSFRQETMLQESLIEDQEEHIAALADGVNRLNEVAVAINYEIKDQNHMLDDLDNGKVKVKVMLLTFMLMVLESWVMKATGYHRL